MNIVIDLSTPIFCILLCIGSGIGWFLWKRHKWQFRYWVLPVFLCYILMLIKLTILPIHIFTNGTLEQITSGSGKYFVRYQIIPFASIKNYFNGGTLIQFLGNIALLSPLAVFAEVFLQQRPKAWIVALGVSVVSLLIEITQFVINLATRHPSRAADVDDLILNITGIVIAIIITRVVGKNQKIRKVLHRIFYR